MSGSHQPCIKYFLDEVFGLTMFWSFAYMKWVSPFVTNLAQLKKFSWTHHTPSN